MGFIQILLYDVSAEVIESITEGMTEEELSGENIENMIDEYQIMEKTPKEIMIFVMYYSFTTLSTVGFGDIRPYSDIERCITIFILVAGVSIFSVFLGDLGAMIEKNDAIHADLEQGDELDNFLNMLVHFNGEAQISEDFIIRIRNLFAYRWEHDKNLGVVTNEDRSILEQLPKDV